MQLPSGDVVDAINRVAARPEGNSIKEFLQMNMNDTNARLSREQDAVTLRQLQGHAQVFDMLLKVWKP